MVKTCLSIIIVNFNTRELLRQCLLSIEQYLPDAQVIVVDNASQDSSVKMIRDEFAQITLLTSEINLGFAGANNLGIAVATGEFLVLLNSDTVVEDDTLAGCASWMQSDPKLGAVTPLLIGFDGEYQSCQFRFMTLPGEIANFFRQPPKQPRGDRDPDCWLPGTALVLRREALNSIGGTLDASYFMYVEDADLSMKLRNAGWDRAVYREGSIRHFGGASGAGDDSKRNPILEAWKLYGRYRWARKHLGLWRFSVLWCFDLIDIPRLLLSCIKKGKVREWPVRAQVMAASLMRALTGSQPPKPQKKLAVDFANRTNPSSTLPAR